MGAHGGAMMAIRTGIDSTTSESAGRTGAVVTVGGGSTTPPVAPWELAGECVVALVRSAAARPPLPAGLHPLPGPLVVTAARFTESPVGPLPGALGGASRPGWGPGSGCASPSMVVDSAESRLGGRVNWGIPKELGTLRWLADGDDRTMAWEERDVVVRAVPCGAVGADGGARAHAATAGRRVGRCRRSPPGPRPAGTGARSRPPMTTGWPAWPARTGAWCCRGCASCSTPPAAPPASPPPSVPPCGRPSLRYRGRGRPTPPSRATSSTVERCLHTAEVRGSTPRSPTQAEPRPGLRRAALDALPAAAHSAPVAPKTKHTKARDTATLRCHALFAPPVSQRFA